MKTIQLSCPKKVKKAIGLQSDMFEINQSSTILEKLKNYATQNKSRITFGLKIINAQGEDEFEEHFVFTSESTTNLLVLLRQALYSENYSETPSTEKEKYLLEVEKDYNEAPMVQETKIEPKTLATSQSVENESIPFWKGDPFKVMLIFDVVIACTFLWMINLHTLAILIPVVIMILGGIIIAFKKFGRKMDKKQTIAPANIIVQSEPSKQEEVLQPQIEVTNENAFPSASEPMSQEEVDPFPSSSEITQSKQTQDDLTPPAVAQTEPQAVDEVPVQPEDTFLKDSDLEPQPKPVFKAPHTVKSTPEENSSIKSAEENRNQNLKWLSQQIQHFKDEEMQVIINKQRELEALHPETIEALNEAKDKIDEIYQLQLAFEKKWKVA